MCGIIGQYRFNYHQAEDDTVLQRMMQSVSHRGPDDCGSYCDGPVALGFRRLAIVDLSEAGHQPMSNEDGTIWLVFNGEIYNYAALRSELLNRGHVFRSR